MTMLTLNSNVVFSIFDTEVIKVEDDIKKESKPIIEAPKGKVSHH